MGRGEAAADPARRWWASAAAGVFYIVVGLLGGAVVALIAAFPKELVLAVAGLALLSTIGSGLATAMKDEGEREAALAYARVFTEAELNEIAAFYNTTAGKKLISDGPIVTRQVLEAAEIWQTGIGRDLAEAVAKEIESKVAVDTPAADPTSPVITPEGTQVNQ